MPVFRYAFLSLMLAVLAPAAVAQQGAGVASLRAWPTALYEGADAYPYDLLIALDSLALDYRYRVRRGRPHLKAHLAWAPGPVGVLENEVVPREELPEDLRIVTLALQADVVADGQVVGRLSLVLDSLALAPLPERLGFVVDDRTWEAFFDDLDAETARTVFEEGFTLENLDVLRIAVAPFADDRPDYYPRRPAGIHAPDWVQIFLPRWPAATRGAGKRGEPAAGPTRKPREGVGRAPVGTEAERPRTRGSGEGAEDAGEDREEDDGEDRTERTPRATRDRATRTDRDDNAASKRRGRKAADDDTDELMPAALMGAAAIGAVAFGGGTLGYFGHADAPVGLAAGRVRSHAGVLLQVAANEAVFGGEGTERLLGRITSFYDLLRLPIQPALGVGVVAEAEGEAVRLSPSLSLGAAGNFGPLVLLGGYDVVAGGVDFGLAFNWRRAFFGQ